MSEKITKILGADGEEIYIQYDEQDSDELQAVGYIDDIQDDIQKRTERLTKMTVSTVRSYSKLVLDSVKVRSIRNDIMTFRCFAPINMTIQALLQEI